MAGATGVLPTTPAVSALSSSHSTSSSSALAIPSSLSSSIARIQAVAEDAFALYQKHSGGQLVRLELGAAQEECNRLWGSLKEQMIIQAKHKWNESAWPALQDSSTPIDCRINFSTGIATITCGGETREFPFDSIDQGAFKSLSDIWGAFQTANLITSQQQFASHNESMAGLVNSDRPNPFDHAEKPAEATDDAQNLGLLRSFRNQLTGYVPPVISAGVSPRRELFCKLLISNLRSAINTKIIAAQGIVDDQNNRDKAAKEKAKEKLLALRDLLSKLEIDQFALTWALNHLYAQDAALTEDQKLNNAKQYIDQQVDALAAHFKYDDSHNVITRAITGKGDWNTLSKSKREGLESYFREIAMLGMTDPHLHALVAQHMDILEAPYTKESALLQLVLADETLAPGFVITPSNVSPFFTMAMKFMLFNIRDSVLRKEMSDMILQTYMATRGNASLPQVPNRPQPLPAQSASSSAASRRRTSAPASASTTSSSAVSLHPNGVIPFIKNKV